MVRYNINIEYVYPNKKKSPLGGEKPKNTIYLYINICSVFFYFLFMYISSFSFFFILYIVYPNTYKKEIVCLCIFSNALEIYFSFINISIKERVCVCKSSTMEKLVIYIVSICYTFTTSVMFDIY